MTESANGSRSLILAAMIFAVAMTFIDQTIVSIAAPRIQSELSLTGTDIQWAVNSYLLALAALFAFGGRLADTVGDRRMVVIGIVVFAAASAMCGLTPKGSGAEAWLVTFRAVQGIGGALMYPAALAIVVGHYPVADRGKALALFFGIAGGLTAVGPALGGYLTEWTWRAIFWINIPVAVIALLLIVKAKPVNRAKPAPLDYRGLALITGGAGLSVFGFQQSASWGWSNPLTWLTIVVGAALLVVFFRVERHTENPLINVRFFADRPFLLDNVVLGVAMMAFVPIFFFASEYAQIALGENASKASLTLLYFFAGFVVAAQVGGRMLDRVGPKRPIVLGCALACVGLALWAHQVPVLKIGPQVWRIVLTGAGIGMMLGQTNTAALNRATDGTYGEATGITQTVRNYGSSLGLAVLGTILAHSSFFHATFNQISDGPSPPSNGAFGLIPLEAREAFANSIQHVLYAMSAIMGVAAVIALLTMQRGHIEGTADLST
ncbi:MAG TPA: MFS transporter [Mycobacteriales bacterium]|jgi:EmrB/QacA subfamily drug resistance transporter|nr:MFS transporter [Mycobacteriales bacterium]